jgi:hypothetical protein
MKRSVPPRPGIYQRITLLAVLAILAAHPRMAAGESYTWSASSSGDWTNRLNWSPSTSFPSESTDSATINSSLPITVTENSTLSIQNLSILSNQTTLNLGANLTLQSSVVLPGVTNLTSGASRLAVSAGSILNQGTLNMAAYGTLSATSGITNNGFLDLLAPTTSGFDHFYPGSGGITNNGTMRMSVDTEGGGTFSNQGVLQLDSYVTYYGGGNTSKVLNAVSGAIHGNGNFYAPLENHGLISRGDVDPVMWLWLYRSYQQFADGVLQIELDGTKVGVDYDQLLSYGPASIAGTLRVALGQGFMPKSTDRFEIVRGGISGQFANTPGGRLVTPDGTFLVTYNPDTVVLSDFMVPEPSSAVLLAVAMIGIMTLVPRGRKPRHRTV